MGAIALVLFIALMVAKLTGEFPYPWIVVFVPIIVGLVIDAVAAAVKK